MKLRIKPKNSLTKRLSSSKSVFLVNIYYIALFLSVFLNLNELTSALPDPAKIEKSSRSVDEGPAVYFTFTRWEDRTFSPRLFYILLNKFGLDKKLRDINQSTPSQPQFKDLKTQSINPNETQIDSRSSLITPSTYNRKKFNSDLSSAQKIIFPTPSSSSDKNENKPISSVTTEDRFLGVVSTRNKDEDDESRISYPGSSGRVATQQERVKFKSADIPEEISTKESSYAPSYTKNKEAEMELSKSEIDSLSLGLDVLKNSGSNEANFVLSPYSLLNILSVLYLASGGNTRKELQKRLEPPFHNYVTKLTQGGSKLDDDFLVYASGYHKNFQMLSDSISKESSSGDVTIEICNRLIVDNAYPIKGSFQNESIEFYDVQTDSYDFGKDGNKVVNDVNNWVKLKTKGKISSVLEEAPSSETSLLLINAVYFKGKWNFPFSPKLTRSKSFEISPSQSILVPLMTNVVKIPYYANEDCRVIGLPYVGTKVALFVYLPTNPGIKGLQEMEASLTVETLKKISKSMTLKEVTVQLPKIRIETTISNLEGILQNLGLSSMFSPQTANFTRMSDTNGLHVGRIVQKTIFELNEKGTEAAAVSVATGDRILGGERPIRFTVNRPFAFSISNIREKTTLFFGRITHPVPLVDN